MTLSRTVVTFVLWAGMIAAADTSAQTPPDHASSAGAAVPDASVNPVAREPLAALSATREHPLFSPSRRMPTPPPPPPMPEAAPAPPPRVSLSAVLADATAATAFVRTATGKVLRLRVGDEVDGWTVTEIASRRIAFSLKGRSVALALFEGARRAAGPAAHDAVAEQIVPPAPRLRQQR